MSLMNNQTPENIRGEPLELDVLLDFAEIDTADIESASEWFDTYASDLFVGALDAEPVTDDR